MKHNPLARAWLFLAILSLLVAGLLSVAVTGAKASGIKEHITNVDLIRWCLVLHVNLSALVWFTSVPAGILLEYTGGRGLKEKIGLGLSVVGILLMFTVPPVEGQVILSNYVPMLDHVRYHWALGLYVAGVALTFLTWAPLKAISESKFHGLSELGFGLFVGALIFLMAAVTTVFSYRELLSTPGFSATSFFEMGMWGGGHLLQHSSSVFLICSWILLLSSEHGSSIFTRKDVFPVFALMGLSIFAVPLLLYHSVMSHEFRQGFTYLMQFTIFPSVLLVLGMIFRRWRSVVFRHKSYKAMAFLFSAALIVLGFVYGFSIRGSDMRVPGHYHASIGAVTLALMALSYHLLSKSKGNSLWMLRAVYSYGMGQTLFASGMFIAGAFGMARKTYGSEHHFANSGQTTGFILMAGGGLIALTGGIFFALAVIPLLLKRNQ